MDIHIEFDADINRKRNLDRRRETSRYAARDRRGREADVFTDLKEVVPIVEEATVTHVDRIALLRVAATLCRLRRNAAKLLKPALDDEKIHLCSESTLLECLDGFLAIIDCDGIILYVTESVSIYLGLTQTDLTGRFLKDFIHGTDYEDFSRSIDNCDENGRMITMRMKSVISSRGRNLNLKSALYKPVMCQVRSVVSDCGRICILQGSTQPAGQGSNAATTVKNAEIPNGTFMTRHTCDMKFSYVSESFNYVLRHEARSLLGTSFYNLIYPADLAAVTNSLREMFLKGHSRTQYYRLIGANDSVIWVQTEATTVNHTSKGHKGQYVICVHNLLGIQREIESFKPLFENFKSKTGITACIKRELDDNAGDVMYSKKGNYDEVLQWLFRDRPNSPAPTTTLFRPQECQKRTVISTSGPDDPDPLLATAVLCTYRNGTPDSSGDDIFENSTGSPYADNVGVGYSPLAVGVADCNLRSSGDGSQSCNSGNVDCGPIIPFSADYSIDRILNPLRVSTIPSTDGYSLSNADVSSDGSSQCVNLYTSLPSTDAQYPTSITYDQYSNSPLSQPPTNSNSGSKSSGEELFEHSVIQMLAPFVPQEDIMQLSTDIHGLLPDFNFDWMTTDSVPLQARVSNQSDPCDNLTNSGAAVSVISKSDGSSVSSSPPLNDRSDDMKRVGVTSLARSHCCHFSDTAIDPSQWIQQQYRVSAVQTAVLGSGYTWEELGLRPADSRLQFHRDAPTVQQQRV